VTMLDPDPDLEPSDRIAVHLGRRIGARVSVIVTENATTMVSYRWKSADQVQVRVHEMFGEAENPVLDAVAAFVRGNRGVQSRPMDEFIRANRHRIRRRERRLEELRLKPAAGVHHDLGAYRERLNRRFFAGHVTARITWGRQPPRRGRRHHGLGANKPDLDQIRVKTLLDQPLIPRFLLD
jgi:hypothetical protein